MAPAKVLSESWLCTSRLLKYGQRETKPNVACPGSNCKAPVVVGVMVWPLLVGLLLAENSVLRVAGDVSSYHATSTTGLLSVGPNTEIGSTVTGPSVNRLKVSTSMLSPRVG